MATNNAINQIGVLPAFMAVNAAQQTGISYPGSKISFDTVIFDNTSSYNNSTFIFTAPLTGKYSFSCSLQLNNCTPSMTNLNIFLHTTQSDYYILWENFSAVIAVGGFYGFATTGSFIVPMTVGDAAYIFAVPYGDTLSVNGKTATSMNTPVFSGYMISGI